MLTDHPLRIRADRVVRLALSTQGQDLLEHLDALAAALPEPTELRAQVELARAVAQHTKRRPQEAAESADVLLAVSEATEEPGWAAVGHALHAVVRIRAGSDVDSFESLVAAEQALTETAHAGLRCTAHHWLGMGYYVSRLYELAVPHLQRAAELHLDHTGESTPAAPLQLALAGVYLRWADDLELLGDPALQAEITQLREAGEEAAQRTAQLAADSDDTCLHDQIELMLATARKMVDPAQTVQRLTALLTRQPSTVDSVRIYPQLACARAELGQPALAREAARLGVSSLHPGVDLPVSVTVQHVALRLDAEAGDSGAVAGLRLARTLAAGWWEQRLRDLHAIRKALEAHELAALHLVAHRAAREDPLTGVGNRRALDERLAATDGGPVAVILMDLDHFKAVNDTLGHVAGDALLCRMADRIRDCARPEDLVARLGGDEFVVVCSDPDGATASRLVRRLRDTFSPGWSAAPEAAACGLGVSFGSASTREGVSVSDLLEAADVRLYADKRLNREAEALQASLPA